MTAQHAPLLASTILLLRDNDEGRVEVFMEKRHMKSTFVGGAYVFPGGRVDDDDHLSDEFLQQPGDVTRARIGTNDGPAYEVAALRECFEEAGVLLAYDANGDLLSFADEAVEDHYRSARNQLNAGDLSWQSLLEQQELRLANDRLHYWSHWITPLGEPRRYDTRFFVTEAPIDQTATHDDWELTNSAWVEPATALDKAMAREWFIIFPTLHTLKRLEDLGTTQAALEWAAGDHERPINQPKIYNGVAVLPGDEGYEDAEEDISGADPSAFVKAFKR